MLAFAQTPSAADPVGRRYRSVGPGIRSEFNLTEATRWSRERLVERGVRVNRQTVGVVTHGAAYGGCPLYRHPPPEAEDIGAAFVANVIDRAAAADIDLSSEDIEEVRNWFGLPTHARAEPAEVQT